MDSFCKSTDQLERHVTDVEYPGRSTKSLGGLPRTLNVAMLNFAHFRLLRKCLELTLCPCLNLAGLALENTKLIANDQFTPNYSVFARK